MRDAFQKRRDFVVDALRNMPGVKINNPEGAFYAFPNISFFFGKTDGATTINNDEDFSMYLLHKAHVSTVNGGAFGNNQCIRISFATSMDNLETAMERIAKALQELK
jgi:aspartate aminotransferase